MRTFLQGGDRTHDIRHKRQDNNQMRHLLSQQTIEYWPVESYDVNLII